MTHDDRREFQRMRLSKPILALMNEQSALILDIGISGAYIEHFGQIACGERFHLTFRWYAQDIEYVCEVARSIVVRQQAGDGTSVVSHTGAHFIEPIGQAEIRLQDMMATFVGKILSAQKANATAKRDERDGAIVLEEFGEARRVRSRGYLTYRLVDGRWWRHSTKEGDQPPDGFTVAAHEDEEELETLCRSYETADAEGRRLIRLVAELSARSVWRV